MRFIPLLAGLFFVAAIPLGLCAADTHRVVVVSQTNDRISSEPCEIRVVEIESGSVLARVTVGATADAVLTREGDLAAVISQYHLAGVAERHRRLEIYRTSDLSLVQRGIVPVRTGFYRVMPSKGTFQFSADGKELIVQRMESGGGNVRDGRAVLTRLQRELDDAGMFKIAGQPFKLPNTPSVRFISSDQWPRIAVWTHYTSAIEVLDVHANSIRSALPLGVSPADYVVTDDGKSAYFVPHNSRQDLRKIDLTADPPKVVRTSQKPQPELCAHVAAVSEKAGTLFVGEFKLDPTEMFVVPSPLVKTFDTQTLAPAADITLSDPGCDCLTVSHDGKHLYALDFAGGMAVVDIATGKEVKVLRDVGAHPGLVFALP